jgi:hypothetical protein
MNRIAAALCLLLALVAAAAAQLGPLGLGQTSPLPAVSQSTSASPAALTPGTSAAQMLGLAGTITPVSTGRVHIEISGTVLVGSTTNGAQLSCRYGTGAAPANAGAAAGTVVGLAVNYLAGATTERAVFHCAGVVTGLTLNTAIWIDLGVQNTTGSQATTITQVTVAAFEL